jgi:hypothetical protein
MATEYSWHSFLGNVLIWDGVAITFQVHGPNLGPTPATVIAVFHNFPGSVQEMPQVCYESLRAITAVAVMLHHCRFLSHPCQFSIRLLF